ncbi:MAG TPA: hypothetical protein VMG60_08705 [Burkholderiaceae bacterium]|nr:hypothetical protein [Burkholderiaceae bacterium]
MGFNIARTPTGVRSRPSADQLPRQVRDWMVEYDGIVRHYEIVGAGAEV